MKKIIQFLFLCCLSLCEGKTIVAQKPIIFVNKSTKELFIVQQKTIHPHINIQQSDSCVNSIGVIPIADKMSICQKGDNKSHDKQELYSIEVTNELPECIEIYEDHWKSGNIGSAPITTWTNISVTRD